MVSSISAAAEHLPASPPPWLTTRRPPCLCGACCVLDEMPQRAAVMRSPPCCLHRPDLRSPDPRRRVGVWTAPHYVVDLRGSTVSASRIAGSAQRRRAVVETRALVDVTPCASLVGKEPKLMACMRGTSRPGPRDDDRATDVVPTTRCSWWTT
ncbi:uncharacterized protein [Zea mays]|uniref:uncharacterized protein n=1 Tax=Zea mays TaxID=4577 RepID=UPI001651FDD1|nr:uncharacterized protein LOC118476342 [Zea mays]